jgi:hypothetical protein
MGLVMAGALLPLAQAGTAQAASVTYKATLSPASEVPPVTGAGSGTAAVNVDTTTKQISWRVDYSGLSGPATAAHIHCGAAAGANAGVAVPLPNPVSPIQGSGMMTDAQMAELEAGKCYVNIHTEKNKGGELRGQLAK